MTARFLALAGLALLFFACGSRVLDRGVSAEEAYPPTFKALRARILLPRCGQCHGLFLSHDELTSDLVAPGDVEGSDLYSMVSEKEMPPFSLKLTDDEIAAIRAWIEKGAPND